VTILSKVIDERFLTHRRQATSTAGIIGAVLAICLFAYRFYIDHILSWDLLAVGLTFVGVKLALMAWYFLTD
jgi:hypothetical protein